MNAGEIYRIGQVGGAEEVLVNGLCVMLLGMLHSFHLKIPWLNFE